MHIRIAAPLMRKNIARPQTFQRSGNRAALRQQPADAQGARKALRLKIRRQSNRTRTFLNTRHAQRSSLPANRQQPNGRATQVRTGVKRNAKPEVCTARPESQTSSFWACDTDPNVEPKCERNPPCPISDNSYFPESPHYTSRINSMSPRTGTPAQQYSPTPPWRTHLSQRARTYARSVHGRKPRPVFTGTIAATHSAIARHRSNGKPSPASGEAISTFARPPRRISRLADSIRFNVCGSPAVLNRRRLLTSGQRQTNTPNLV